MSPRLALVPLALTLVVLALAAAGCGGGASPSVAAVGTGTTSTTSSATGAPAGSSGAPHTDSGGGGPRGFALVMRGGADALKLSRCMRAHGVPNFPDPSSNGSLQLNSSSGVDPNSPQFRSAMQACQKVLPNGGKQSPQEMAKARQQALAFSACMRKHGVKDFPDPQFSAGRVSIRMRAGAGSDLNPQSPAFQAAQRACGGFMGPKGGPSTSSSGGK